MEEFIKQLTLILAVWGAVLSTVALGWNVYRGLSDRGRLRVTCYIANLYQGAQRHDDKDYLAWSVVNVGRQPLFLRQIGGKSAGKKNFMIIPAGEQLPKVLRPGETYLHYSADLDIITPDTKALGAWDTHGRFYKISCREMKELKQRWEDKRSA